MQKPIPEYVKLINNRGGIVYGWETSNVQSDMFGKGCTLHSHIWIGGDVIIGDNCKIQSFVFIPNGVRIGNKVFIGPHVCFTNDKHPPSNGKDWSNTIVEDYVSIGAGAVILPGVVLKKGCRVGAGAVVTESVPMDTTVVGNPAKPLTSS